VESPSVNCNRIMGRLSRVGCVFVLVGIACALVGQASASAGGEAIRAYPTHQSHPEKIKPGFVNLGRGRIDAGLRGPQRFAWWVAAEARRTGPDAGESCFSLEVIGPLARGIGAGQNGASGCLEATAGGGGAAVIAGPLHRSSSWSEFDVGVAAYEGDVESVRLVAPDGRAKVVRTREIGRDLSVPGLEALHYVVFAVSGCVKRVEAEEAGSVIGVARLPECR
jgi:hypothetical protein